MEVISLSLPDFLDDLQKSVNNIVTYKDHKRQLNMTLINANTKFLVVIVMFNMLIAIMADSFDNVQENLKIQSFRAKARVCADLLIDFNKNHGLFKQQYLHICTVKDDAGENAIMSSQSQWEGRLKAVKREIKEVEKRLDSKISDKISGLDIKMSGIESKISGLESKMDRLLEAIIKK